MAAAVSVSDPPAVPVGLSVSARALRRYDSSQRRDSTLSHDAYWCWWERRESGSRTRNQWLSVWRVEGLSLPGLATARADSWSVEQQLFICHWSRTCVLVLCPRRSAADSRRNDRVRHFSVVVSDCAVVGRARLRVTFFVVAASGEYRACGTGDSGADGYFRSRDYVCDVLFLFPSICCSNITHNNVRERAHTKISSSLYADSVWIRLRLLNEE